MRSVMRAASQLPGRGPTVVDIAPVPDVNKKSDDDDDDDKFLLNSFFSSYVFFYATH